MPTVAIGLATLAGCLLYLLWLSPFTLLVMMGVALPILVAYWLLQRRLSRILQLRWLTQPAVRQQRRQGYEDFAYPGTKALLDRLPTMPDLLHCHNLHGDYFDLTALPWLSRQRPVILHLHDDVGAKSGAPGAIWLQYYFSAAGQPLWARGQL